MESFNSIYQYEVKDYGKVIVKLSDVLEKHGITRNRLRTLTGVKYAVIDRYYKGVNVAMADLNFLAKVCFVLDCEVGDLLEYIRPDNAN
ncbi:MAG: helix-turn-helix transcriptional regulator [Eubacteriales bacterium]|nr:helix-turn-helix transcriptional regulator [Eubacteriales bacterium]